MGTYYYVGQWNAAEESAARYLPREEADRPDQVPSIDTVASEPGSTKKRAPQSRKEFPSWPHPNGQWAKRIDGEIRNFRV